MTEPFLDQIEEPADYEPLSSQWSFQESWKGDSASYALGSVMARIQDIDGVHAAWEVQRGGEITHSGSDPDFWDAIEAVEEVLIDMGWLYHAGEDDQSLGSLYLAAKAPE